MHTLLHGPPGTGKLTEAKAATGATSVVRPAMEPAEWPCSARVFQLVDRYDPRRLDALLERLDTAASPVWATANALPHDDALLDRFLVVREHTPAPYVAKAAFEQWVIDTYAPDLSLRRKSEFERLIGRDGPTAAMMTVFGETPVGNDVELRNEYRANQLINTLETTIDLRQRAVLEHELRKLGK